MMGNYSLSLSWHSRVISVVVFFLVFGFQADGCAAEAGEFSGKWIANGVKEVFISNSDIQIYTFDFSGHINLQSSLGKKNDYWAECVGLSDSATGATARCVWKDLDGAEIYVSLQSGAIKKDKRVTGIILGGSEKLEGISGEFSYSWSSVSTQLNENGRKTTITGQTLDLSGSYVIP
jgi:hypothetical protein